MPYRLNDLRKIGDSRIALINLMVFESAQTLSIMYVEYFRVIVRFFIVPMENRTQFCDARIEINQLDSIYFLSCY